MVTPWFSVADLHGSGWPSNLQVMTVRMNSVPPRIGGGAPRERFRIPKLPVQQVCDVNPHSTHMHAPHEHIHEEQFIQHRLFGSVLAFFNKMGRQHLLLIMIVKN